MTVFTFSQARQSFASILEQVRKEGEVIVKRKNGSSFVIKLMQKNESPVDVKASHYRFQMMKLSSLEN